MKDIPYEAEAAFLPDRLKKAFVDACAKELAGFVAAAATGKRAEWIMSVLPSGYVDFSDETVITDLISRRMDAQSRSLLECSVCGRIYAESVQRDNRFVGFKPEPVIPARTHQFEQEGAAGFVTSHTEPATMFGSNDCPGYSLVSIPNELRGDYGRLINREQQRDESNNGGGQMLG